jgi:hypothetical protein
MATLARFVVINQPVGYSKILNDVLIFDSVLRLYTAYHRLHQEEIAIHIT